MRGKNRNSAASPSIEVLETRLHLAAQPAVVALTAAFAGRLPGSLPVSGENRIVIRATNSGGEPVVGAVSVELFASADKTLDSTDALLGTATQSVKLGRGRGMNIPIDFATPTTLPDGKYFLIADVNDLQVAGAVTNDEIVVSSKAVTIDQPFSDVSISFDGLPNRPIELNGRTSGKSAAIVDVLNVGNVTATYGFTVSYFLSADAVLDSTDPLLAQTTTAPVTLRPGQGKGISLRLAVPPGTAIGGYFLFAVLTPKAGTTDSQSGNDVAISDRRVAVVSRLPQRPVYVENITIYYQGPDYFYDETAGYGYYTDAISYSGSTTSATDDQTNQADSSTTQSTQPSDGLNNDSTGRTNDSPANQTTDPPTTQPTTDSPATQPTDPADDGQGNGGGDSTTQPTPGGDSSGTDDGSGNYSSGDYSTGDGSSDSSDGSDGSSDDGGDSSDALLIAAPRGQSITKPRSPAVNSSSSPTGKARQDFAPLPVTANQPSLTRRDLISASATV